MFVCPTVSGLRFNGCYATPPLPLQKNSLKPSLKIVPTICPAVNEICANMQSIYFSISYGMIQFPNIVKSIATLSIKNVHCTSVTPSYEVIFTFTKNFFLLYLARNSNCFELMAPRRFFRISSIAS